MIFETPSSPIMSVVGKPPKFRLVIVHTKSSGNHHISFLHSFHSLRCHLHNNTAIMIILLSDHYVAEPVTVDDLQLASLAWGFTIGFGFLTTWTAITQTADMQRRYGYSKLNTPYIWMIWLEILVCLIFSIICWLHLNNIIPPRYFLPSIVLENRTNIIQFCIFLRYS